MPLSSKSIQLVKGLQPTAFIDWLKMEGKAIGFCHTAVSVIWENDTERQMEMSQSFFEFCFDDHKKRLGYLEKWLCISGNLQLVCQHFEKFTNKKYSTLFIEVLFQGFEALKSEIALVDWIVSVSQDAMNDLANGLAKKVSEEEVSKGYCYRAKTLLDFRLKKIKEIRVCFQHHSSQSSYEQWLEKPENAQFMATVNVKLIGMTEDNINGAVPAILRSFLREGSECRDRLKQWLAISDNLQMAAQIGSKNILERMRERIFCQWLKGDCKTVPYHLDLYTLAIAGYFIAQDDEKGLIQWLLVDRNRFVISTLLKIGFEQTLLTETVLEDLRRAVRKANKIVSEGKAVKREFLEEKCSQFEHFKQLCANHELLSQLSFWKSEESINKRFLGMLGRRKNKLVLTIPKEGKNNEAFEELEGKKWELILEMARKIQEKMDFTTIIKDWTQKRSTDEVFSDLSLKLIGLAYQEVFGEKPLHEANGRIELLEALCHLWMNDRNTHPKNSMLNKLIDALNETIPYPRLRAQYSELIKIRSDIAKALLLSPSCLAKLCTVVQGSISLWGPDFVSRKTRFVPVLESACKDPSPDEIEALSFTIACNAFSLGTNDLVAATFKKFRQQWSVNANLLIHHFFNKLDRLKKDTEPSNCFREPQADLAVPSYWVWVRYLDLKKGISSSLVSDIASFIEFFMVTSEKEQVIRWLKEKNKAGKLLVQAFLCGITQNLSRISDEVRNRILERFPFDKQGTRWGLRSELIALFFSWKAIINLMNMAREPIKNQAWMEIFLYIIPEFINNAPDITTRPLWQCIESSELSIVDWIVDFSHELRFLQANNIFDSSGAVNENGRIIYSSVEKYQSFLDESSGLSQFEESRLLYLIKYNQLIAVKTIDAYFCLQVFSDETLGLLLNRYFSLKNISADEDFSLLNKKLYDCRDTLCLALNLEGRQAALKCFTQMHSFWVQLEAIYGKALLKKSKESETIQQLIKTMLMVVFLADPIVLLEQLLSHSQKHFLEKCIQLPNQVKKHSNTQLMSRPESKMASQAKSTSWLSSLRWEEIDLGKLMRQYLSEEEWILLKKKYLMFPYGSFDEKNVVVKPIQSKQYEYNHDRFMSSTRKASQMLPMETSRKDVRRFSFSDCDQMVSLFRVVKPRPVKPLKKVPRCFSLGDDSECHSAFRRVTKH